MPICPACGSEIPEGANLCNRCEQLLNDDVSAYKVKDPATGPLYELRFRHYIEIGWQTFRQYSPGFLLFGLVVGIFSAILMKFPQIPFVRTIILTILQAGMFIVSAKLLQSQNPRFADFFAGFHYFRPLLIFGFISGFFAWLPEFLKIFSYPSYVILLSTLFSLIFSLFFLFTPLIIIDRRLGFWQAMQLSQITVQRRLLHILGFLFLFGTLISAGDLIFTCLIILFLALFKFKLPFWITGVIIFGIISTYFFCVLTAAYADIFGLQSQEY
jgi:hypothetical protein